MTCSSSAPVSSCSSCSGCFTWVLECRSIPKGCCGLTASDRAPGTCATCTSAWRGFFVSPHSKSSTVPKQNSITGSTCKCIQREEPPLSTPPRPPGRALPAVSPAKHGNVPHCVTWVRRQEAFLYMHGDWKVLRAEIISRGNLGSVQNRSEHLHTVEPLAAGRRAGL